jgi:ADP-heptose:LPS heptosyltransferase
MNRILFIQLYRYGDLIQSTPAIAVMRKARPEAHIAVLVREPYADALEGNPDIDEVIRWDTDILSLEDGLDPAAAARAKATLRSFVHELRRHKFDTVFNLSSDLPSALLTYMLNPTHVAGLVFCRDRRYRVRNDWIRYLFLATEVRHLNGLNIADIFIEACSGTSEESPHIRISNEDRDYADEILRKQFRPGVRPVAIQPGAGRAYKRWPVSRFTELTAALARNGADLIFLGTDEDAKIIGQIRGALPKHSSAIDLAGKTSLPQMAAILKRCHYLVANEGAATQVAAAVHTPCLTITYGPTCGWETGSYGAGHFILEPASACFPCSVDRFCTGLPCRDVLTADMGLAAIQCLLNPDMRTPAPLKSKEIVLSRTSWMADGMLGLEPINHPELAVESLLRLIFRSYVLGRILKVHRERPEPKWEPWRNEVFDWYHMNDGENLAGTIAYARNEFASLASHAEAGRNVARAMIEAAKSEPASEKASDHLAQNLAQTQQHIMAREENEHVRFLVTMFRHGLRDMDELPPVEKASVIRNLYERLMAGCDFVSTALDDFLYEASLRTGATTEADEETIVPSASLYGIELSPYAHS